MGHLEENIDLQWNKWKNVFFGALNKNIPKIKFKPRRNVHWITSSIRRLLHKRKRLWKRAKVSQLQSDWDKYKIIRNKVKSEMNKAIVIILILCLALITLNVFGRSLNAKTNTKSYPSEMKSNNETADIKF